MFFTFPYNSEIQWPCTLLVAAIFLLRMKICFTLPESSHKPYHYLKNWNLSNQAYIKASGWLLVWTLNLVQVLMVFIHFKFKQSKQTLFAVRFVCKMQLIYFTQITPKIMHQRISICSRPRNGIKSWIFCSTFVSADLSHCWEFR